MAKYIVYISKTVSSRVEVDANSLEEALDSWYEAEGAPEPMSIGAFGYDTNADEEGDWQVDEVTDNVGKPLWNKD